MRIASHDSLNNRISITCNHEQPIQVNALAVWQSYQRYEVQLVERYLARFHTRVHYINTGTIIFTSARNIKPTL